MFFLHMSLKACVAQSYRIHFWVAFDKIEIFILPVALTRSIFGKSSRQQKFTTRWNFPKTTCETTISPLKIQRPLKNAAREKKICPRKFLNFWARKKLPPEKKYENVPEKTQTTREKFLKGAREKKNLPQKKIKKSTKKRFLGHF